MARIAIVYEPGEPRLLWRKEHLPPDTAVATLNLPDGIADLDMYDVARRLAELLLEACNNAEAG